MSYKGKASRSRLRELRRDYQIYLFLLPTILYFIIFCYVPMGGIQIAFKEYSPMRGISASEWVGLDQFIRFFNSYQFRSVILNTLEISFYNLIAGFPIPIVLALLINQINSSRLKKGLQTATYAPHFISVPAVVGMLVIMLSPGGGLLYNIIDFLTGGNAGVPMGKSGWFSTIYVVSGIWQHAGWDAIIYIASLTGISPDLYEAAEIDGANKWQKIRYIDIPSIMPTAVILLIMNAGRIMSVGFEKVLLMQNAMNLSRSEIISTYVYKIGLIGMEFSYSTAIGLFNSLINLLLMILVNQIAKKYSNISVW